MSIKSDTCWTGSCDRCGLLYGDDPESGEGVSVHFDSADDARRLMIHEGWTLAAGRWTCRRCSGRGPVEPPQTPVTISAADTGRLLGRPVPLTRQNASVPCPKCGAGPMFLCGPYPWLFATVHAERDAQVGQNGYLDGWHRCCICGWETSDRRREGHHCEGPSEAKSPDADPCPTHGDVFMWFGLTCLACEAEVNPERAAELAAIGIWPADPDRA